jgi:hypothetical protein
MPTGDQKAVDDTTYVPPPGADQVRGQGRDAANDQTLLGAMLARALGDATPAPPATPPATPTRMRPARAKETKAVASTAPATSDAPAAAASEVARSAPPIARREIVPQVRMTGQPWWQQMVAELLGFLVVGVGAFAIDMLFTVVGITELGMPATAPGYAIACLIHVGISIGQRHYLFQRGVARWIGAVLLSANSLANVYGMLPVIDQMVGSAYLGDLPRDPTAWPHAVIWSNLGQLWKSFWNDTLSTWAWQWPPWSTTAILLFVGCIGLAWFAEYLLMYFWRRVQLIWFRRPA